MGELLQTWLAWRAVEIVLSVCGNLCLLAVWMFVICYITTREWKPPR